MLLSKLSCTPPKSAVISHSCKQSKQYDYLSDITSLYSQYTCLYYYTDHHYDYQLWKKVPISKSNSYSMFTLYKWLRFKVEIIKSVLFIQNKLLPSGWMYWPNKCPCNFFLQYSVLGQNKYDHIITQEQIVIHHILYIQYMSPFQDFRFCPSLAQKPVTAD